MKKNIICFGDSNTHGYQYENSGRFSEEERWTCLLQKNLGSSYQIIEEGLNGRTTVFKDPLFEGVDGLSYIVPCLLTHKPIDLLIIMLGTNDTKERFGATSINIATGLDRLIRKAISTPEAWNKQPNILIIAPPPIAENYASGFAAGEMGRGCTKKSKELVYLYQEVAKALNCHFLDAGNIPGIKMDTTDYIHLNKESHAILADKLSEIVPTLFKKE